MGAANDNKNSFAVDAKLFLFVGLFDDFYSATGMSSGMAADCFLRNSMYFASISLLDVARMEAAKRAALTAPCEPIDIVPTGIPFGMLHVERSASSPPMSLPSIGTPRTGMCV